MEVTNYASKGAAATGISLGATGLGVAALNAMSPGGFLSGLFSGRSCGCSDDHVINRYEAAQSARIAELETEVKLRDANAYTDKKSLELYGYIDSRLRAVEGQICNQAVVNAQVTANLSCMQGNIATLMGLTKTIIPITNVCPEPMPQYNSWTAPTATT